MKDALRISIVLGGAILFALALMTAPLWAAVGPPGFSLQECTVTNLTTTTASGASENSIAVAEVGGSADSLFTVHEGAVFIMTNCILHDASGVAYGGTNYTVTLYVGNNTDGVDQYQGGWSGEGTNASYYATLLAPTYTTNTFYIQTRVMENATSNTFIYPKYEITIIDVIQ